MNCTLMHRKIPVVDLEVDDAFGTIRKVGAVYAPAHLPLGVPQRKGIPDRAALNEWWLDRTIPMSRSGIRKALQALEVRDTGALLLRCDGFSLSDQYWVHPEESEVTWERMNFYDNPFSEDVGDVLFGENKKADALNLSSPDNTSDGNLKKRWRILNGKRCLVKGGSNPYRQQPLNEVIASKIMDRLNIPHVQYDVIWDHGAPYSVCEDFVTADTELVPAWRIIQIKKKANNVSVYRHFAECAETLGIPQVVPFLDRMIVLDFLIANEDRHFNNFGAVRNAETLEWIGMAPIYDSGSSLGYDKVAVQIRRGQDIECKPFKKRHEDQLRLVSDFSWIDLQALRDVREMILETMSVPEAEEYLEENRIAAIADSVEGRIHFLQEFIRSQHTASESTEGDVTENIAKTYESGN